MRYISTHYFFYKTDDYWLNSLNLQHKVLILI